MPSVKLADAKHQIRLRGLVPLTPGGHQGGQKSEKSGENFSGVLSLATFFRNFIVFLVSQNESQKSTKIRMPKIHKNAENPGLERQNYLILFIFLSFRWPKIMQNRERPKLHILKKA